MTHVTKLSKQGNSLGVRIPKEYLERLGLAQGDSVVVKLLEGGIEITRAEEAYNQAMDLGRQGAARYRRALARLAR
ncbi:MAG: AbrB/MazE/SpoVT family DNA-binding domain-containing protein [Thermodesulfobacteriota bacterium]